MEKNNKHTGNFVRGFVWGAVLGAGLVYFLKTEKGRQLMRKLKDEGIEQLSSFGEMMEDEEQEIIPRHDHTHSPEKVEPIKVLHVHTGQVDTEVDTSQKKEVHSKKTTIRKMFKGIGKK